MKKQLSWTKAVNYLNLNTMKNYIKLTALIVAVSFAQVACEKDQNEPANRMNAGEAVKSKNYEITNKSSEELLEDILSFIDHVTESSLDSSFEAEDALLYTEAALNYRLTNDNHLPSSTHIDTTEYYVEIDDEDGLIISTEKIQSMNDDLYDVIYSEASDYNFEDNMDGKFISFVDMDWSNLGVGSNLITVAYSINNFNSVMPTCNFTNSFRPIFDMGGCNGNPATSSDAGKELNKVVNYPSCNTELNSCQNGVWAFLNSTDEIIPWHNFGWSQTYTNTSIWDDTQYLNVCLNASRMNELRDSCIWISTQEKPSNPDITLKNISVGSDILMSSPAVYLHTYKYTYGQCLGSVPDKPKPCFNCI